MVLKFCFGNVCFLIYFIPFYYLRIQFVFIFFFFFCLLVCFVCVVRNTKIYPLNQFHLCSIALLPVVTCYNYISRIYSPGMTESLYL
jgi:hypothetical protein